MTKKLLYIYVIIAVTALTMLLTSFSAVTLTAPYLAAEVTYSGVIEDLKKDSKFDAANYPVKADDYTVEVINVAESVDKELFIYTYQPSGKGKDYRASSINISTTVNDAISPRNYSLEFLNSSGTLYKYMVNNFTVATDPVRYYAIPSIFRPFDAAVDADPGNDNVITEKECEVAKQYEFGTVNGNAYVSVVEMEVITITDKFVGFVRYSDGFVFMRSYCDSHFVAFNTNKKVDKLLEADVFYTKQSYRYQRSSVLAGGELKTFGVKTDDTVELHHDDTVEHKGDGWFAGTYSWNRIETVDEFIAENNITQNLYTGALLNVSVANKITDAGMAALRGKQWVLRFAETEVTEHLGSASVGNPVADYDLQTTLVGDVTILRLKFETDGVMYNLGVVDNKQTGGKDPINNEDIIVEVTETAKKWLMLLAIVLLFLLLLPVLPYILRAVVWFVKMTIAIIAAPFKALNNASKASKNKSGNKSPPKGSAHSDARIDEKAIAERAATNKKRGKKHV